MTKQTLSIIGVGAFGEFALTHLAPHFDMRLYDEYRDLSKFKQACDFETCAKSDIIILAVPIHAMEDTIKRLSLVVCKGQLIIDIASVKCKPVELMTRHLPNNVDIVATHPIFGPQSGANGIEEQNVAVVNVQGNRDIDVISFLKNTLQLNVIVCTAEEHDQQMAYVQGLTHMIAKIFKTMDVPEITQSSKTYELLQGMVDLTKNDSDDLFRAIQTDNPYVGDVKAKFFKSVRDLENKL